MQPGEEDKEEVERREKTGHGHALYHVLRLLVMCPLMYFC
jgi:hypothetical protein